MTKLLHKYLATRAAGAPWSIEGCDDTGFAGAVVIPALSESERLFDTLDSLETNPPALLERFLVVVVVNHREDASPGQKDDNLATLRLLRRERRGLRLGIVDAAAPGLELPRNGGVGLARKIGLDLALPRLCGEAILVCLDADTLVEPEYLQALLDHFARSNCGGAVLPFRHQRGRTESEDRAITLYELYLRHYVFGLEWAGSPYAFHTVGSAMACSARAYLRMGGMNNRSAGEDFYFLQQLKRTAGVAQVSGCTVHPSARSSWRVPFGTGKSISRLLADGEEAVAFYRTESFAILKKWIRLAEEGTGLAGTELLSRSRGIHGALADYLQRSRLPEVWDLLRANNKTAENMTRAFHEWFDSLKTVRLMHHLSTSFPRCRPVETVPLLLAESGYAAPQGEEAQLEFLRSLQQRSDRGT